MDIVFILVEVTLPENVGAAARAAKTMGISGLRVVNSDAHTKKEARWLAHASGDILDNIQSFDSFDDAVSDLDFIVASTARKRSVKLHYHPVEELLSFLKSKGKCVKKTGIVFGSEESGLDNEILRKCDLAATIPLRTTYPSLNLAQAVMIFAYELSDIHAMLDFESDSGIQKSTYKIFRERLEAYLKTLAVDKNENLYFRILERVALLPEDDIKLLLSVLNRASVYPENK